MNNEELLEMIKNNGNKAKEYDRYTLLKGDNLAVCISMIIAIILFLLKLIVRKEFDIGVCAVFSTAVSIQYIHEGLKYEGNKLNKWVNITLGSIMGLGALIMIFMFVCGVIIK